MPKLTRWNLGPREQVLDVHAVVDIAVSRSKVWSLIKPAESAVLLDPNTVRAFHVPGTPVGIGEMQGFISRRDGREHVSIIEVLDEVSGEYAVTRNMGGDDDAYRMSYFLASTPTGTRLEIRVTFTVTAEQMEYTNGYIVAHRRHAENFAQRAKLIAESRWHGSP